MNFEEFNKRLKNIKNCDNFKNLFYEILNDDKYILIFIDDKKCLRAKPSCYDIYLNTLTNNIEVDYLVEESCKFNIKECYKYFNIENREYRRKRNNLHEW